MDTLLNTYIFPFYAALYPQWIDVLWFIPAIIVARPKQRLTAISLILCGIAMMRLQVEMLDMVGYTHGIIGFLPYHIFLRGLVTYGVVYLLFFAFIRFASGSRGSILLASAISFFFLAFFASTIVMVL